MAFWAFDILIVSFVVIVVSLILHDLNSTKKEPVYIEIGPYKEYETALTINKRWQDEERTGWPCNYCGMDDTPIVIGHPVLDDGFFLRIGGPKCKWCAELENINLHLSTHGVRRWQKN